MAAENFKVKKGLEVGTGITANSDGVNVTGIITATQFKGDGSGLTGVVGSGSGVVIKDEGSAVGTAGTVNFVGSGVAATLSAGTATVTINAGGLDNVVEDTTPELGGNLDLNSKFVTGSGGINVTGVVTATTLKGAIEATTASFSGAIDANGDLDVDGHTELDNLNVAGVSTFSNGINLSSGQLTVATSIKKASGTLDILADTIELSNADANSTLAQFTNGAAAKLYFNGNQKLTTTINGIEVPDLNVTGVGTVGRLDTSGVTLGTNNNTFAAKFIDDAVANFGTDNDLKISHDDTHARITNTKGNIVVSGIISATSDVKVGSAITMDPTSGIITATSFSGSGSGLTSIPSAQLSGALPALDGSALTGITASGSGIIVKHDGSTVGTAGTINFSTNLDVSAISAGIVTVTASGGGVSLSGSTNNTVATVTGANALIGEANLTFDGSTLAIAAGSDDNKIQIDGSAPYIQFREGTTNKANIQWSPSGYLQIANEEDGEKLRLDDGETGLIWRVGSNDRTVWTSGNDGASSGLNADLLDGEEGSYYTNASNLGIGTIPNGRFPATLPAIGGGSLTDLNATALTTGTVPTGRFGTNNISPSSISVTSSRILGRVSSGTNSAEELTAAQVRTLLNVADGATAGITTAPSNITATWSVTASDFNAYEFTGPGQDGSEDDPDIYLIRGHKYRFINTTGSSHPFRFKLSANGTQYTDGISGSENGTQDFSVQHDAPASLVYQCTQHPAMVGNIYIVGQHLANGANNRVLTATSAYGMNGEANLTFDGTTLSATGQLSLAGGVVLQPGGTAWSTTNNRPQIQRQADGELRLGAGSDSSSIVTFYTSPSAGGTLVERLRIQSNGIVKVESNDSSGLSAHLLVNNSESNSGLSIMGSGSSFSSGGWAAVTDAGIIRSSANSSNGLVLQAASGDLRFYVGGNPPAERLRINSSGKVIVGNDGTTFGNAAVQAFIQHGNTAGESGFSSVDTTSVAQGVGGEIAFHGKYNTGAQDWAYFGHIRGIKENATNGNTACALTFHTRPNATAPQERLRITSTGNLEVKSATGNDALSVTTTASASTSIIINTWADNTNGRNWAIRNRYTAHGRLEFMRGTNNTNEPLTTVMYLEGTTVHISGSFSATSTKNFKISHPLSTKKETHDLIHSSIEGPQADLIYRGVVDLVDGTATVNIDTAGRMTEGTFEVLCTNVSCFTSNETDWTAVKGSVSGNILTITAQDNTSTASVSWMVVGERKDQGMIDSSDTDANGRLITETLKESVINN